MTGTSNVTQCGTLHRQYVYEEGTQSLTALAELHFHNRCLLCLKHIVINPLSTTNHIINPLSTDQDHINPLSTDQDHINPLSTDQYHINPSTTSHINPLPTCSEKAATSVKAKAQKETHSSSLLLCSAATDGRIAVWNVDLRLLCVEPVAADSGTCTCGRSDETMDSSREQCSLHQSPYPVATFHAHQSGINDMAIQQGK